MSLLKRLEQGQGQEKEPQREISAPSEGEEGSRLSSLQARRATPPGASGQRDTYLDLKTRVQNR